jgi:acetolactate synthase I/II/III large subunit
VAGLGDVIVDRLRSAGTRTLFGVPGGGGNLDLIDAARAAGLPFVLTSTESGAAMAALAQAEVTGHPGACLTTLGPGALSAANGVACACLDRAPIVVFTDSNPERAQGRFSHQQIDQLALFAPITRWSARLSSGDAGAVIDRAFREVLSLPPGPVHVDCAGGVFGGSPGSSRPLNESASAGGRPLLTRAPAAPVAAVAPAASTGADEIAVLDTLLARARKPLLLIGLGARRAEDAAAIRRLCERRHVPAMVTYKAKGVIPDMHACFAGVFTNAAIERPLVEQSDLLIGVGLDPVELLPRPWTFAQPVAGIHRWRVPDDHVPFVEQWITDIAGAMPRLEANLRASEWDLDDVAETWRRQRRLIDPPAGAMTAQHVVAIAARELSATSRVTVDAGAHMFPATMGWPVQEPNGLLISNGLSTMGFALPAAVGAALIERDNAAGRRRPRPVVVLTGDGGLLMCLGELLTAVRERLRIITVVFNDASLSLIEIKQQARRLPAAGVALGTVGWVRLAEGFGVAGSEASTETELARAIGQAVACEGPSLIEARIDRSHYGKMLQAIRG